MVDPQLLLIVNMEAERNRNKSKITRRNDINEYMVLYDVICFIIGSVWNDNLFLQDDKKYN